MARPHKYAWNGLDFETALPIEHVANMAQRAAQESTGDLLKGKHRIVSTRSGDREIEFRINDFLISFKKFMVFSLTFQPTGDRLFGTSTIGWYMTSQQTVGGFVPVSTKSMVAHNTYMQFARNLAEQIRHADPTARVTIREGVQADGSGPAVPAPPLAASGGAATLPVSASSATPLPPPPAPVRAIPQPPPPLEMASGFAPPPSPGFAPPPAPTAVVRPLPHSSGLVTGIPGMPPKPTTPLQAPPVPPPPAAVAPPSASTAPLFDAPPIVVQIFAEDDDLDSTRISQATADARHWTLVLSDGQRLTVDVPIVIGRDPVAPASVSSGRSVPVVDAWKSVSKTHAVIEVRDGMLWVTDLHSTNGTTITNPVGEAMACPPEVAMPVGDGWTISAAEVSIVASLGG